MSFKDGYFRCWACNEGGDIIALVGKLFDISPLESVKKLNADFGLSLDLDRPTAQTARQADDSRRLLKCFEEWEKWTFYALCLYLFVLMDDKKYYAPKTPGEEVHPLFIKSCYKIPYIEYLIDLLIFESFEKRLEFFKVRRMEVRGIVEAVKTRINESA